MRFVEGVSWALRSTARRIGFGLTLVVALTSCADGFLPASSATTPAALSVNAVRVDAIRVAWTPVEGDVVSYVIERRRSFTGAFEQVAQVDQRILTELVWIDSDVAPETYYGYRVYAVTSAGDRSAPSVVGGALTPPRPGIDIRTTSVVTVSESLDPDGYEVVIAGPDTVRAGLGVAGTRRVSPLRPGRYTVTISGIVSRCAVNGTMARTVDVTDSTATTIAPVAFEITCRDPSRGELALAVAVTGDSLDNAFLIDILGQAADTTLPASERVYSRRQPIERSTPVQTISNLRPGTYDIRIDSIAGNCTLTGPAARQSIVSALAVDTVRFAIACRGSAPPVSSAPFVWRNTWVPQAGPTGSTAELEVKLDLSAKPAQGVTGVQGSVSYDAAVLRYEEVIDGQIGSPTVNSQAPGLLTVLSGKSGAPVTGVVTAMKLRFTVIGAAGSTSVTTTRITKVSQTSSIAITDSVRAVEDTFTVGSGTGTGAGPGSGAANQLPVAQFSGPTAGTVGAAVVFNGTASSDPDGTISSYAWVFGDNTTSSAASPSKTYTTAGSYTVRLAVTDNRGGTATRTATITIAAAATPTPPPGTPVPPPAPPAPAPAPPPSSATPLSWRNVVQPYDLAQNLVEIRIVYDLGANLTETPGAEALQSFVVDSLKWDPSLLQFVSINLGPGITGTSNQAGATVGRLGLRGTLTAGLNTGSNIVIANIRFRPVGAAGRTAATSSFLGPLIGTAAVNFFSYNSKTAIIEGQFTLP